MNHSVSVCMVNHNGEALLNKYLPIVIEKLNETSDILWELIFCDNGSDDNSVSVVEKLCPNIKLIQFPTNMGFGESNNVAIRASNYEYILLLNNDIKPSKNFLTPLIQQLEQPNIFAVAPRIYRFDRKLDDGIRNIEFKTGLLTPVLNVKQSLKNTSAMTTFFCGGAVLFKKDIFFELGGFDEIYDPYSWEDLDLSYRAWKHGYSVQYVPRSEVFHDRETTAKKVFSSAYRKSLVWRNRFLFMWKNLSVFPHLMEHLFYLPAKLIKFIFTGRTLYVVGFLWAVTRVPIIILRRISKHSHFKRTDTEILTLMRCE